MASQHSVFVVLTTECDKYGECLHCFYNVEPERHAPARLDAPALAALFRKLRLLNISNVYLTGGEPLMRDDLEEIVRPAAELDMNTFLLTNGRSADTARIGRLEAAGLDVLILSLSAVEYSDRAVLNRLRRLESAFLSLIYVLHAGNWKSAPEVVDIAMALDAGLVFQPAYIPVGHELAGALCLSSLSPFDWSELYTALRRWAAGLGYQGYLDLIYDAYHKIELRPERCGMGYGAFVIDADGEVYPCFHRRDLRCGNVLEDDIGEILDNLNGHARETAAAACFGRHCISLHTGFNKR